IPEIPWNWRPLGEKFQSLILSVLKPLDVVYANTGYLPAVGVFLGLTHNANVLEDVLQHFIFAFQIEKAQHRLTGGWVNAATCSVLLEVSHKEPPLDCPNILHRTTDTALDVL